jgi:hypothetical protein
MTDNERRVLQEWSESFDAFGGPLLARDMAEMIEDLLNADSNTDVTPQRPAIGEQVWLRSRYNFEWSVWTATSDGIATYHSDGKPWVRTWSEFDRHVANGTWQWKPLGQPND